MSAIHSAFGYLVLLLLAWLAGRRSRLIPWKTVGVATLLQLAFTGLFLQPAIRQPFFNLVDRLIKLLQITALQANKSLLFSGVTSAEFTRTYGPVFALELASILIFIASLSRLHRYVETISTIPQIVGSPFLLRTSKSLRQKDIAVLSQALKAMAHFILPDVHHHRSGRPNPSGSTGAE